MFLRCVIRGKQFLLLMVSFIFFFTFFLQRDGGLRDCNSVNIYLSKLRLGKLFFLSTVHDGFPQFSWHLLIWKIIINNNNKRSENKNRNIISRILFHMHRNKLEPAKQVIKLPKSQMLNELKAYQDNFSSGLIICIH